MPHSHGEQRQHTPVGSGRARDARTFWTPPPGCWTYGTRLRRRPRQYNHLALHPGTLLLPIPSPHSIWAALLSHTVVVDVTRLRRPCTSGPRRGCCSVGDAWSVLTPGGWGRTIESFTLAEHLLDVPRHDLLHLSELLVHLVQVALCARVQIQPLCLLDEGV